MKLGFETLEPRLAMTGVVINEILASSSGTFIQDEDGHDSDYIELYNSGETSVNLDGWYLTDNDSNLTKWELPAEQLDPGEYLVIFASSKNRAIAGSELHTNFNLSADGEYLALVRPDGVTVESSFGGGFPEQYVDASFGIADIYEGDILIGQGLRYFVTPTPGSANGEGVVGFVSPVEMSVEHGFYENEFWLELETETGGAEIYYTFDGSLPGPDVEGSFLYQSPILISRSTVVRAAAHKTELGHSQVSTQTYLFVEDVLTQTIDPQAPENNPFGLAFPATILGAAADYNIDPSIVSTWDDHNPDNDDYGIREALLALPTMSIVMDHDDLWDPTTGIYSNATSSGDLWRRAGSIEYFDPAGGDSFQYNVGIQMHGRSSRGPDQPKKNFRLIFNPEFGGPGRLNFPLFDQSEFGDINTVVLKGMNQDNFAARTVTDRISSITNTNMRDQWMMDTFRDMGHLASEYTYVHLYVNGLYWGLYEAVERMDDASISSRVGGNPEDWDIINPDGEFEGSDEAWNAMFALARSIPSNNSTLANSVYQKLQGLNPNGGRNEEFPVYLDMDNLIDYLLVHYYAGASEWLGNFVAARNRVDPGTGFRFYVWDQDVVLNIEFGGRIHTPATNTFSAQELKFYLQRSPEFRLRFADRAQMHLFNNGALSIEQNFPRWTGIANGIEASIVAESARWGDSKAGRTARLRTGDPTIILPEITIDIWRDAVEGVMDYMLESHSRIINSLRTNTGLYPTIFPPVFNQHGGSVDESFQIALSLPEGTPETAEIFYTLDGSDPRLLGGGLNPSAILYTDSFSLQTDKTVKARIRSGTTWSAIVDPTFDVTETTPPRLPGDYDNNGVVENADYAVWKETYGDIVPANTSGDGNGDGVVDALDYTIWRNNLLPPTPDYKFSFIGQTYTQNFDAFLGTDVTLPNYFSVAVDAGTDIFRGTFDSTTDTPSSFTGIKASTSDGSNYSLTWRESTGPANLEDTRFLFMFTNNTGQAISGFNVSYDVETWVNGRRDNVLRFKYDTYANSDESQAAEGRNAFESDIFSTPNPNHTPIANNDLHFVLDGKHPNNRETVSGYVDLTTLLIDQSNPGLGAFGALQPGETAYFRWQISNGALTSGNRSALGIDNVSITALAAPPAAGSGGIAYVAPLALDLKVEPTVRSTAADLAIAKLTSSTSTRSATRFEAASPIAATSIADDLLILVTLDRSAPDSGQDAPIIIDDAENDLEPAAALDDLALELAIAAF